jgi:hypothetical protein
MFLHRMMRNGEPRHDLAQTKRRRRGIGIELKPDYFDMASNRLRYGTVELGDVEKGKRQFQLKLEDA